MLKPSFAKIEEEFFPFQGGLDLITPAISIKPGRCIDAQNYEPINGQYSRILGFERCDGHTSPSSASYWILGINQTGVIAVGDTLTGATSGATCKVLSIVGTSVIAGRLTGAFVLGESITDSGTVGTVTVIALENSSPSASDDADYKLLAANDLRLDILKVPGSGRIRGVQVYGDIVYAFRDNVGGTAGNIYKATASGWSQITFGREIQFIQRSGTVTITIATPGVVTFSAHGAANGQTVVFSTTGALPTGITAGTTYYVINTAANTFQIAATSGGSAIATSGSQSGTQTATFTGGQINVGDTVIGVSSGASAVVTAALLRTGTWTTAPIGSLVFATVTGSFSSGEGLKVGGQLKVQSSTADTAISRLPGGLLDFDNINFTGSTATTKMYGADSVNLGFEFDGTTYAPIRTGMTTDTPSHVRGHKFYLVFSFLGSVQLSALENPYAWTVVLGASEIAVGDTVSGFLQNGGTSNSGSTLQIFTNRKLYTLYGSSTADFKLVTSISDMGYSAFTSQLVSNNVYGMTARGIQSVISTLTFGDYDYASISHQIQPLILAKKGLEISSNALKGTNQYRVYFSDNTALAIGLVGDKVSAILPLNYGMPVRCITTATLSTGEEVTYFGSDDGYVYQDNVGTSQDGNEIEAWIRLPFSHSKSPQTLKSYKRAIIEGKVDSYAQINVSYDLGYGNSFVLPSAPIQDTNLTGGGGYWDQFTWDQFTWDAAFVNAPVINLFGTETNISMLFYSSRAQDLPHALQGLTLIYSPRRLKR